MIGYSYNKTQVDTIANHRTSLTRKVMAYKTEQETLGQDYTIRVITRQYVTPRP